jgi:hypothetical protein
MSAHKPVSKLALVFTLLLLAVSSAACLRAGSVEVSGIISPPNGLGLGGSGDGITVTFIGVLNDTRCAEGVECVTAGDADVKIGVSVDSAPAKEFSLKFANGAESTYITGDYTIKLLRLLPEKPPVGGVPQGDYQLELKITKK